MIAMCVFGALALLFQPIYKIALGRDLWNVVDVIVAALLIGIYVVERRQETRAKVMRTPIPPGDRPKLEDNKIAFLLDGRLSSKELVYVASEEDKGLNDMFEQHPEVLEGWGQMIGFHIVYLPLLMKRLKDRRVLQYRAPHLSEAVLSDIEIGNDFMLQYLENPADRKKIRQGFIRTENVYRGDDGKDKAINRFYPLSSTSGEPIADQLHRIGKQIAAEENQLKLEGRTFDDWGDDVAPDIPNDNSFYSQEDCEDTEYLMEEIRERVKKLRQRGIAEYLLEQLIHPDNRLSRLVITRDYRILLPDYNDMEIKMEPLVKAVYLLFLKHPEGIVFKSLQDYREELTNIYALLRPTGITDKALQSIEDVTNPLLNSINEKCARIRGAFVGQFDDYMAKNYYIDGPRGGAKKIALPRDLVIWE